MRRVRSLCVGTALGALLLAGCGDGNGADSGERISRPTVVVTTNILGDVVHAAAGGQVDVLTILPIGADPHTFQASAQQVNEMREADALITNGAGFEEGLVDVIEAAADDGVPIFEAISAVETIELREGDRGHDDHADEHDGEHEGEDPHFFTDPARMAQSVDAVAEFLIDRVPGVDVDALRASADDYIAQLEALDADVEALLAGIPDERRVLVTNHEVFGYFADRYGFEVVGALIPTGSTADGVSAADLAELAQLIHDEGVPAVFADTSSSDELARTLAAEAGADVVVVELFSESLGDEASGGATYLDMVRTNAGRIAAALTA